MTASVSCQRAPRQHARPASQLGSIAKASITHQIDIAVVPAAVLDAVRDYGALHTRRMPSAVADTVLEAGAVPPVRIVTFHDGRVLRETIVAVDDERRGLVWAIDGLPVTHHNGALQVAAAAAGGSSVTWTADVLPDDLAQPFGTLMAGGLAAMKAHLEGSAPV